MTEITDNFLRHLEAARADEDEIRDTAYLREVITAADCRGMEFRSVVFDGCRFIECDFTRAAFYDCKFLHCDLSNCRMPDSYWKDCSLISCKGKGTDLTNSAVKQTLLKDSSFVYGLFSECSFDGSSFENCDLSNALLSQVKLRRTAFNGCRLVKAEFFKTVLKGTDLSSCDISGITVSDSFFELRGAEVSYDQAAELAVLLGVKIK